MIPEKTRVILIAHGSRDPNWRRPFERLVEELTTDLGADAVTLCWMEFAQPDLQAAVADSLRRGFRRLTVLPMFLAGGAHLATDIPQQVDAARQASGGVEIEVLPPIGEHPRFTALLRELTRDAVLARTVPP
jgi:sirohydrochlorin cobaltochelatase